jgi:4-hydroxy-tetrahydrodipicolinate synthase
VAESSPFHGSIVAIVTPFRDGELDLDAFSSLVEWHVASGTSGIVVAGTTGESATLHPEERETLCRRAVAAARRRVPVIAGTGTNATWSTVQLTRAAAQWGADAMLVVTPYYNKPTQEGLYQHFKEIAESTGLPVILYNVPGRTSSNLEPATVARLAKIPNIIGIKEASGSITQQMDVLAAVEPGFRVFSGDDAFTFPLMALGGVGIISVVSNEIPAQMTKLAHLCLEGKVEEARKLHFQLLPLMQANFLETNPIPVKAALAMMGLIEEVYRLPLVPMKPENRAKLEKVLIAQGILAPSGAARGGTVD